MQSHEIDYEIFGDDIQMVELELDPGETVIAEAGAMNYIEEDIDFHAKMGDGSEPDKGMMGKLLGAAKRKLTGESIFMTHFTNNGYDKRKVAFAAPYPGKSFPSTCARSVAESSAKRTPSCVPPWELGSPLPSPRNLEPASFAV